MRQSGFTLIELMIVVAIVAIIAMVAYPSYQSQLEEGRLSEGRTALMRLAAQLERCFTQNGTYENCNNLLNRSESGIYNLSVNANGGTFTATATRAKAADSNECGNLQVTETGARTSTAGDDDECWNR
jgi:type IV pilus assembly protein PilE